MVCFDFTSTRATKKAALGIITKHRLCVATITLTTIYDICSMGGVKLNI